MDSLSEKLRQNGENGAYPFHMPGHKRNIDWVINPYKYDITEIDGFDDLHHADGILQEINDKAARLYGADHAIMMVNGSTGGILSAISAVADEGETILLDRISHKSAYNAAFLRKLKTEYIYPQTDEKVGISAPISPEAVEKKLNNNKKIKAVYITSPTYEGIISDIEGIAGVCHRFGVPLIVDSAHGAHLGIGDFFPKNPVRLGADIVIMSTHKTLSSFTQTGILCVNDGFVDYERVKKFSDIYVSSSPSYLLMASIEKCVNSMLEDGRRLLNEYHERLKSFRNKCDVELKKLYLYSPDCMFDDGKIVICTDRTTLSGEDLKKELLQKYNIQAEMASLKYVILMTSYCDTKEGFEQLFRALCKIDECALDSEERVLIPEYEASCFCTSSEADGCKKEIIELENAQGRVAAENVYVYPPGVPWVVAGEVITPEILHNIFYYQKAGFEIRGLDGDTRMKVLITEKK